jgi:hypothetical protein
MLGCKKCIYISIYKCLYIYDICIYNIYIYIYRDKHLCIYIYTYVQKLIYLHIDIIYCIMYIYVHMQQNGLSKHFMGTEWMF